MEGRKNYSPDIGDNSPEWNNDERMILVSDPEVSIHEMGGGDNETGSRDNHGSFYAHRDIYTRNILPFTLLHQPQTTSYHRRFVLAHSHGNIILHFIEIIIYISRFYVLLCAII